MITIFFYHGRKGVLSKSSGTAILYPWLKLLIVKGKTTKVKKN